MDYAYYEKKINDIITKCPIEAGIEILAYNLLDECIDAKKYALVDINRIRKNQDARLSTEGGVPDIAVLSPDFIWEGSTGKVHCFIEIKAAGIILSDKSQIVNQMKKVSHFIYTNGILWKYYRDQELQWKVCLSAEKFECSHKAIEIDKDEFEQLKANIKTIKWE